MDEWQRRESKRRGGVAAIKWSPDYLIAMERLSECDGGNPAPSRPRTPDPTDRAVSKRRWELSVQVWRKELTRVGKGQTASAPWPPSPPRGHYPV